MEPFEIICSPFQVYAAAVGTAFPAINAAPASPWALVGTNGNKNHSEDGVQVAHDQTLEYKYVAGTTGPVKAVRTQEGLMVSFTLWDMTLEHYRKALNGNTVTTVAAASGTAGYRKVQLRRGLSVTEYALLIRGVSPYDESLNAQYEIPRAVQSGNPQPAFTKGNPAALALQFTALEDPNQGSDADRFGTFRGQDAAPL